MMNHLAELFNRMESDYPLWISTDSRTIFAGEISRWNSVPASLAGSRVAIQADSSLELAKCLVALDGVCEAILLLPVGLNETQRESLQVQANVHQTVSVCPTSHDHPVAKREFDTQWILATSGTTGTPKLVRHTFTSLTRTACFDLDIGGRHVWSSLYHLTGFAGLQVFLQAWCGGSQFIMHDDEASLAERVMRMADHGVTALSATPTMWRKMLMATDVARIPLQRITLGGEISDQKILDALANAFPNAKIRQIYASTEAGVGFSVRDGKAGFPTSYLTDPPSGVELRVEDGRLLLRNPKSVQQFVDSELMLHRDDGFMDTGDQLEINGDRFEFLGRANGSINVGGNKVHPEEVERFLMRCEGVAQARVYAKKSPFTGSLVAADVVADSTGDAVQLKKQLKQSCRGELAAYKVPAVIHMVERIETSAAGKVLRNAG